MRVFDQQRRFRAWQKFHAENPRVFQLFVRFAAEAANAGRQCSGARLIGERIRWHELVETVSSDFKVNDHHWPYYSRLAMLVYPESFGEFFRVRIGRFDATNEELLAAHSGYRKAA